MKYRQKAEKVEAIQVRFGKGGWPAWLKGRVAIQEEESVSPDNCRFVSDGDYLVQEGPHVRVYSAEDFQEKFERVRQAREKNG